MKRLIRQAFWAVAGVCGGLLWSSSATREADSCFPEFSSLDVLQTLQIGHEEEFSYRLKSKNPQGIFLTEATLNGQLDGRKLKLSVRFDSEEVSVPYNVYAVLAATESKVLSWQDLTRGCIAPGASVFPGGVIDLVSVKLDGSGAVKLHLVLWGRL